ncbi:hypothetical protein MPSEU_000411500 [Mayamaea pseudoterrestris]|nr:hypothetical protein MPSEU_000411500 [Mayamaea pseudoterrestris]
MAAFGCNCGTPENLDDDEEFTKYTISTGHTHSSDDSDVLNTSYRRATPLFRAIEKENWEGVLMFLTTGKWSNSILANAHEYMKSPAPEIQVKTWVTSYSDHKKVPEWSQLPLHAAISYNAPFVVIRKLVECYPKSIQSTDNEGMLPIHLAFGFGASDQVLALLLEPFPSSINERGMGGRLPYQCCELGPNKARGVVFEAVVDQVSKHARAEVDQNWRELLQMAQRKTNFAKPIDVLNGSLPDVLLELLSNRKELEDLKKQRFRAAPPKPIIKQSTIPSQHLETSTISKTRSDGIRKIKGSVSSGIRSIASRTRRKTKAK